MTKYFRHGHKKIATSPGTVEFLGDKRVEKVHFSIFEYENSHLVDKDDATLEDCLQSRDNRGTSWINIDGLHETDMLQKLGEHYGFHVLVLEDVVNTTQRAKFEDYEQYLYLVVRMLHYEEKSAHVSAEQVSLIVGPNYVVSFQEREGDVFDNVRERIRNGKGRIRGMGADYLAYALLDAVVDGYFVVLEKLSTKIEEIEGKLAGDPGPELLQEIYRLKRGVVMFRKVVWPLRELCAALLRDESKLIKKPTRVFLRDLHDHAIQVIDAVESFGDVVSGLQDLYLSVISNRMNEVMKVLTVIATTFMPLTFLAGIYGMNFRYMPELEWRWAYPVFWVVMIGLAVAMLVYFRRRRWL
jgi:magnesium transporter